VSFTLVLRYGLRSSELEERTNDLDKKSQELELSYQALQEAQAELIQSKQMAAVGELAAVVAHEVRNPLTIVNNAVSSLRKSSLDPEKRITLLSIIEEEVMRLDRLVRRLLTFARPMALERKRVSVEKLVERSLSLCGARPDITVNCTFGDTERGLTGDFDLLRQALENVVANALEAMPEGGAMLVTTQGETLGDKEALRIEVKDTGAGMADTLLDRASQPFVTTRASGTGLGLSIVRRIVEAHGGTLEIDSAEGVGTRVACILPRVPPEQVGVVRAGLK
jgi:signal transduction histidine kinase